LFIADVAGKFKWTITEHGRKRRYRYESVKKKKKTGVKNDTKTSNSPLNLSKRFPPVNGTNVVLNHVSR
jgi:hypothetical protein